MLDFSKLETPSEDGDILIEPPVTHWPELIARNREILEAADYESGAFSLRGERARLRMELGGISGERAVLAAGHQPEFVHPGVWAKHVVLRHVADQGDHVAFDLVVDNHAPRRADLTLPLVNQDGWVETRRVALAEGMAGASYEGRPVLDEKRWREARDEIMARVGTWAQETCIDTYLEGLKGAESPRDFVDQHLAGRQALDRGFEVTVSELRVSEVYGGGYVADLLVNAERFAGSYNAALAEYRRTYGVGSANRPLPDLGRDGGRTETAFWIYRPGARRRRLWLATEGDRLVLYGDAQRVAEINARLLAKDPDGMLASLGPWRVRPRALTLTLWARLLVCDLFVHGIGGAKYDRITDRIIETYYGIEPPAYACVSATLRLPLPEREGSEEDVRAARRELRDVHYNPQRYLASAPEDLVERRRKLIEESDRLRRARGDRVKRREIFRAIRDVNARLLASEAGLEERKAVRLEEMRRGWVSNQNACSREYFYALQPRERLEWLAGRLRDAAPVGCQGPGA